MPTSMKRHGSLALPTKLTVGLLAGVHFTSAVQVDLSFARTSTFLPDAFAENLKSLPDKEETCAIS